MNGKAKSKLQWHREAGSGRGKEGGVRSAERSAVGEAYVAIFLPTPGFKGKTLDVWALSQHWGRYFPRLQYPTAKSTDRWTGRAVNVLTVGPPLPCINRWNHWFPPTPPPSSFPPDWLIRSPHLFCTYGPPARQTTFGLQFDSNILASLFRTLKQEWVLAF